jgi:DNA polymerase-4
MVASLLDDGYGPWVGPAVLHADIDAFFAAVEQLDHPAWRGLPVIVGGDPSGRGVVSTASYEARRFGVHSAMPAARAAVLCPDAVWATPRFDRYKELSDAVFSILRDESPHVQPLSVDEAFVDVTPGVRSSEHPVMIAQRIRERVAALGLTISVGVATSKTVAKIASDHDKPDGLTVVRPGDERRFLARLPVRAMSGVGPRTAEILEACAIRTLGDLGDLDDLTATTLVGSHGPVLAARARGVDPRPVRGRDPVKSVSNERTFSHDLRDRAEVDAALRALIDKVAVRLRRNGLAGRTVTVKVRFSDFTTKTAQRTLDRSIRDERDILPVAQALLSEAWTSGTGLRLLGVGVSSFGTMTRQLDLFDDSRLAETAGREPLMRGVDEVRRRFGPDALRFGRDVPDPEPSEE